MFVTSESADEVITVDEFHRRVAANAVSPKAELIRGRVHERVSKSPRHTRIASLLFARVYEALPGYWVRMEQPLTLNRREFGETHFYFFAPNFFVRSVVSVIPVGSNADGNAGIGRRSRRAE